METEYKDFNISDQGTPGLYDKVLSGKCRGRFGRQVLPQYPGILLSTSIRYDGEFSGGNWRFYYTELLGTTMPQALHLDQGNFVLPDFHDR